MLYRRLTSSVQDKGLLIREDQVLDKIDNFDTDWYVSPFSYEEDAFEYFKKNGNSIKGYQGKVFTGDLYWDLDFEGDFNKVRDAAFRLLDVLEELELENAVDVYFSGNKGVHIMLRTVNEFTPREFSSICYNIAAAAKITGIETESGRELFDTSVYNVNRIFRINNTKHPKSGLYKVQITFDELNDLTVEEIRTLAEGPGEAKTSEPIDAEFLKEKYVKKENTSNVVELKVVKDHVGNEIDFTSCPPEMPKCFYALENGYFGPGERENATIRLAAYYKGQGLTKEMAFDKLFSALEMRKARYTDLNPYQESDIHRNLDQVYSDSWNGGTYSCKTDHFLQHKCDTGEGPCSEHKNKVRSVMTFEGLYKNYVQHGNEALLEYPKTGIKWLDKNIRLRPKNVSIINGANGSGKTSLVFQIMENLNKQEIPHIFFSLDMADTSLFEKLGAKYTDYSQREIEEAFNVHTRNPEIMKQVFESCNEKLPYTLFDFTSNLSFRQAEKTIRKLENSTDTKIQVAIFDFVGLIAPPDEAGTAYASSTQNAKLSNDVAKRTHTHVLALSQIPREKGDHTDAVRTSRASNDSGAWEDVATTIVNVWRPFGNGLDGEDIYMNMYIAKNRSGKLGENAFMWDGKSSTIADMNDTQFSDYSRMCEEYGVNVPFVRKVQEDYIKKSGGRLAKRDRSESDTSRRFRKSR